MTATPFSVDAVCSAWARGPVPPSPRSPQRERGQPTRQTDPNSPDAKPRGPGRDVMNGTPKRESPLSCGEGQQSHLRGRDICVESKGARCWPGDSRWTDQAGGQGRLRQRECLGHAVGPAQLSHPNPRAGQCGVAESMNPQGFCRTSHGTPDEQPATAVPLSTGPAVFTARPFSPGPDYTPRQTPGSTAGSRGVPGPDPAAPPPSCHCSVSLPLRLGHL